MARAGEVVRVGRGVDGDLDRVSAVVRGDTGGDALAGIDCLAECRPVSGRCSAAVMGPRRR